MSTTTNVATPSRISNTPFPDEAPPVIADLEGGYVVVWHSQRPPADFSAPKLPPRFDLYMQRYDDAGRAVGVEIRVNSLAISDQVEPAVRALSDGGFVVSWPSDEQSGTAPDVYAREFDASGKAVGDELLINLYTNGASEALEVAVVDAHLSDVTGFTLQGTNVSITTGARTQVFTEIDRLKFDDALFAFDTQAPGEGSDGGSVWKAAALLWAGLGAAPTVSLLSQWTAQADAHNDLGSLGQAMLDYYAADVSTEALVTHLYTTLAHAAPTPEIVEALSGSIGEGKQFETKGDFFAAAATLEINTWHFVELVGSVQQLELSWFVS